MIEQNLIKLFEHSFKNNWELPAYTNYYRQVTLTYGDSAKQIAKLHLLFEQVNSGFKAKYNESVAIPPTGPLPMLL